MDNDNLWSKPTQDLLSPNNLQTKSHITTAGHVVQ